MAIHPLAGKPVPAEMLIDLNELESAYYKLRPDPTNPTHRVNFGTSGHRGSPLDGTFNEQHIAAITQAICEFRQQNKITGPLYMGKDSHAISAPAERTALEVLAANGVETIIQGGDGLTPTPSISRAILVHNRTSRQRPADGIVVTPSHNPPSDGGFKYNPPGGGPADTDVTHWIQERANDLLERDNRNVKRVSFEAARKATTTREADLVSPYVNDLTAVIDLDAIRDTHVRIGVDPLGGAALPYWQQIADRYRLELTIVNDRTDATFSFMTLDHDGKIRMDCSSRYAMASLVTLKDRFQIAAGNDADADRHGIVTPSYGLMDPNHYLAVAIDYLLKHRPKWKVEAAVGKTLVSSLLIDRVVARLGRRLYEVPVGFKWFSGGLLHGDLCFGGEESAGASFLCRDGTVWTTDKDGILLSLLAAEMVATTGHDPGVLYDELTQDLGVSYYERIDLPVTGPQREALHALQPEAVNANELAGEPITAKMTKAPGNGADIGGLKVVARSGWFAVRPSGTENLCKVYAESLQSKAHLKRIQEQAMAIVHSLFAAEAT